MKLLAAIWAGIVLSAAIGFATREPWAIAGFFVVWLCTLDD